MSIENKIEELTTSINNLASILGGATKAVVNTTSQEVVPTKTVKKVKEVEENISETEDTKPVKKVKKTKESEETVPGLSSDDLIALARNKIAEGHDRTSIKNKITELGAAQISALTPDNLVKFKEFLDNLTLDEAL